MLTLSKQIKIQAFAALAEIGIPSKSEEILAILELAKGSDGIVRSEDVNSQLLDRPADSPHGQRILMLIESYGLLEKIAEDCYRITTAGSDNLEQKQIMVPEEGSYILFTTDDPLLCEAIVRVERDTQVEHSESLGYFGRRNDRPPREQTQDSLQKPDYLEKYTQGHILRQVANSNTSIQINSVSDRIARTSKNMNMTVAIQLAANHQTIMKVRTSIGNTNLPETFGETRFDKNYVEVLTKLVSEIGELDILDGEPTLLVNFNSMKAEEVEKFRKQVTIGEATLWEFGPFKNINFSLPILPATRQDAIQWANQLLRLTLNNYTDKTSYEAKKLETAKKFEKKFDQTTLASVLTPFDQLITEVIEERKTGQQSPLYWRLIAPQDLTSR